ncbi:MAG: sigma-70 family RNA polymerase sigma factor [Planctomycetota bacterium]|nr:MAG: sigma-70 family RNA polymerase sigma factor [Planctomycetota bacterium]
MSEPAIGDEMLIERCRTGDADAWRELVDRYGRLVYSIPRRYGLSPADADDVYQAVFASLHVRLPMLRSAASLPAWLVVAARRECWRRRDRERMAKADLSDAEVTSENADRELLLWERREALRAGLDQIGEPCRTLLTLLFLTDKRPAYAEIAEELGLSVGSIGPMRARCFEKLERVLRASGLFDER